ncbi:MAG TPA: hypothetical protein VFH95_04840 [Candidatus Kapabacteria bacterium]|nr:hypothetical protein [Candidatus Kapabacteria bacterium]
MKKLKTSAVLSFIALLCFGVASCFNPTGPAKGTGSDSVRHGLHDSTIHRRDSVGDTVRHHRIWTNDTMNDTIKPPPPPPPPPPDTGGLDSTTLDSMLGHK